MAPIQYSELTSSSNGLNNAVSKTTSSSSSYQSSSSMAKSTSKSYSSSYKIVDGKVVDQFSNMSVADEGASNSSEKSFKDDVMTSNNSSSDSYSHHNTTGNPEPLRNLKDVKSLLDFEPLGLFPIIERGLFFQDSFFDDWQEQWEDAIKDILDRFNARLPNTDDFSSYRTLRENDLREENQANSLEIEGNNYKIVVDVRDFMVGDLKVEAVGNDEIKVTGSVDVYDGKNVVTKTFNRKFHVPGPVDHSQVTATMSADGVLTIRIPKTSQQQPQTPPKISSPEAPTTGTPRRSYRRNAHGGYWKD
ncbi:unnamed protein product [Meganyctiphanes norvegica]|uniref:SHSP domain-containing protein n=1 Tax=Meganyctiphanes norvegica TaxID=48144 RepID=A0AAV2QNT4_MEGNR